jgi:hypothetical protein
LWLMAGDSHSGDAPCAAVQTISRQPASHATRDLRCPGALGAGGTSVAAGIGNGMKRAFMELR